MTENQIDYNQVPETLDDKLIKLEQAIKYLIDLNDPSEIIKDITAFEIFSYIIQIITSKSFNEKYTNYLVFSNAQTAVLFGNIFLYLAENIDLLDYESAELDIKNITNKSSLNEKKISIMHNITLIVSNLTSSNMFIFGFFNQFAFEFSMSFCKCNGLKALILFFSNEKFLTSKSAHRQLLIVLFLDIIKDLSAKETGDKTLWKELSVVESLKKFKMMASDLNSNFKHKNILPIIDEICYLIKFKPLSECLGYLNEIKEPLKLIDDRESFKIFYYIYNLLINNRTNKFELFIEYKCELLFFNMLEYFVSILDELDYITEHVILAKNYRNLSSKRKKKVERQFLDMPNLLLNLNERRTAILGYIQLSINRLLNNSIKFRNNCIKIDLYKLYLRCLSNGSFAKKIPIKLLKAFCVSLYNLSRYTIENKHVWIEMNAVDILLNLAELFKDQIQVVESVYVIIPNVATDEQIEGLPAIGAVVDGLMNELKIFEESFKNNKKMVIIRRELLNDDNEIEEGDFHVKQKFLTYLIQALQLLAINEKMKTKIFVEHSALQTLKTIIFHGFDIEKRRAIRLLSQLCFDEEILDVVKKDTELNDYLKELSENKENKVHKDVVKACKETRWILTELNEEEIEPEKIETKTPTTEQHIMISYNRMSREICLKIKDDLEKLGLKVWIDVTNIHGSSLESMANAVENSYVFLMCVSENYRQSINCQAEAQYAFKLNKFIIPLIFEEGYENVKGWLGIIMGDKIFVNFKKYSYDECMRRLKNEINAVNGKIKEASTSVASSVTVVPISNKNEKIQEKLKPLNDWTNEEVISWFKENKLSEIIIEAFQAYTGEDLAHLYKIKKEAPEFFYTHLATETKNQLKLLDVVHCVEILEKLIKN